MSRTIQRGGSNSPIKRYLSFKGSNGKVIFWDKSKEEKILLDDLSFAILDIKSSIGGFNEKSSSSITSNMLDPYDVGTKEFTVKSKVDGSYGVVAKGIYKNIKKEVIAMGGKFTTNIIALADVGFGQEIVRIELNGASLAPWIEFSGDYDEDIYDLLITIKKGQLMKRSGGKSVEFSDKEYKALLAKLKKDPMAERPVTFFTPAFSSEPLSTELGDKAIEADKKVQDYFNADKSTMESPTDGNESVVISQDQLDAVEDIDDDLPF